MARLQRRVRRESPPCCRQFSFLRLCLLVAFAVQVGVLASIFLRPEPQGESGSAPLLPAAEVTDAVIVRPPQPVQQQQEPSVVTQPLAAQALPQAVQQQRAVEETQAPPQASTVEDVWGGGAEDPGWQQPQAPVVADNAVVPLQPRTNLRGPAASPGGAAPESDNLLPWGNSEAYGAAWPLGESVCDRYFGNGFVDVFDLVKPSGPRSGYLRCRYNSGVKTSICDATFVAVDPSRVKVSPGGEPLEAVIRRPDEAELPVFHPGAFEIAVDPAAGGKGFVQTPKEHTGKIHSTYRDQFKATTVVVSDHDARGCTEYVKEPTLFLTRYEYANLFHTSTDWYNVVMAGRVLGLGAMPIVLMDGHCQSPMDPWWTAVLPTVTHIKQLKGKTCYERAVFVPLGYESPLSNGIRPMRPCPTDRYVREFSDIVLKSFDVQPGAARTCSADDTAVLFVRRLDYKAHPRHNGRIVHRITNEADVMQALRAWARKQPGRRILEGVFSTMTLKEQIEMVQQACVIVGAHGAGLSHILFARPGTQLLEVRPPSFRRPHFKAYAKWAGAGYTVWDAPNTRPAPSEIVSRVQRVVTSPVDA